MPQPISPDRGAHPEPCYLTKDQVEEYAARVAKVGEFEIGGSIPDLVERFGGRLRFLDMGEWLGDSEDGSVVPFPCAC